MSTNLVVVTIGLDEATTLRVSELVPKAELTPRIFDETLAEATIDPLPSAIVCAMPETPAQAAEMAQTLRMNHQDMPLFLVAKKREGFDRAVLKKNGFTDAFLFPTDSAAFSEELLRAMAVASNGEVKAFRSVQLIDIKPEAVLGFDLYLHLPANDKKIRYVGAKDSLGAERSEKLKKHNLNSMMVPENQVKEFYKFTAQQLKNLMNGDGLSATERKERRERAIRDLFSGILSDSGKGDTIAAGRELMGSAQGIVKAFIVSGEEKASWYSKLMDVASAPNTPYNHAANTATLAALFSIGLGVGDPKDLALAGLLHDIGLSEIPEEISRKSVSEMTTEELEIYAQHPGYSIALIKERKIIVTERVMKIIEQHHERFDGTGFPSRTQGTRMLPEAQILAIADRIDELTAIVPGKPTKSISDAIEVITSEGLNNPSNAQVDPTILRNLGGLLKKSA